MPFIKRSIIGTKLVPAVPGIEILHVNETGKWLHIMTKKVSRLMCRYTCCYGSHLIDVQVQWYQYNSLVFYPKILSHTVQMNDYLLVLNIINCNFHINPLASGTCTVHYSFVLWILFMHWLFHKPQSPWSQLVSLVWPHLISPIPDFFFLMVFVLILLSLS